MCEVTDAELSCTNIFARIVAYGQKVQFPNATHLLAQVQKHSNIFLYAHEEKVTFGWLMRTDR